VSKELVCGGHVNHLALTRSWPRVGITNRRVSPVITVL
jgi:hypothetical protein